MTSQPNSELAPRLSRISRGCGALAVVFGSLVLTGWIFHIPIAKMIVPGQVAMKFNTALCFVILGAVLWHRREDRALSVIRTGIATLALVFVAVVGGVSLVECITGWHAGIDQLLFTEPVHEALGSVRPGLMSPITAVGFLLLAPALILLQRKAYAATAIANVFCAFAATASLFGVLDFVLDPRHSHTHISPITASLLLILSFAIPTSRRDRGLGALLASETSGGMLARRLLPASILIPVLLGWLRWRGASVGLYSEWAGVSLMAVSAAALLATVTLWTAYVAEKADYERMRAQDSNSRLASIVNCSSEAIIGKTLDGTVISWNQAAEETYGYTAEEMIGRSISRIVPPGRLDEFNQILERICRGERIQHFESERVRKDGTRVQVAIAVAPIKDAAGRLVGASTVARDIGEQKAAETKLRQQAALLELAHDAIIVRDMQSQVVYWNSGAEQTYGFSAAEAQGKVTHQVLQTEFPVSLEVIEACIREKHAWEGELIHTGRDGRRLTIASRWSLMCDEQGTPNAILEINRDITERKKSEEALQVERQRFRDVLDKLPVYVVLLTPDYHVAMDNSVFRQRFGESHGRRCYEYLFGRNAPCDVCDTYNVLKDGLPHQWKWTGPDGRNYDIYDFPFTDSDGSPLILEMGLDVTERNLAQAELKRLNEELDERVRRRTAELAASNRELEAFTYSVSHDLRAPLRHISGFSKILLEDYAASLPEDARHLLDRVCDGTRRMGLLVDDLLNLGRVGRHELRLQVTGLNTVVRDVISGLRPESEGRQVEWEIGTLPYVECDPGLMGQVFQNLLSNALKFTRPRPKAVIEVGQKSLDGIPGIFVRDNGVGFNMKYADKLFGVFQRLHRSEDFEGTGVGLATVQRIIQKHGGRIWAEAEVDRGATFYFTIGSTEQSRNVTTSKPESIHELA